MATSEETLLALVGDDLSMLYARADAWHQQNIPEHGTIRCKSCHHTVWDTDHHPSCPAPLIEALLVLLRTWRGPENDLAETDLKNVRDMLHDVWPDRVKKRPGYGDQRPPEVSSWPE